jgi:hypothetical protein
MATIKLHCRKGHHLTEGNVKLDKRGHRKCRQCFREKRARSKRKRFAGTRITASDRRRLTDHVQMERDHHYADWLCNGRICAENSEAAAPEIVLE